MVAPALETVSLSAGYRGRRRAARVVLGHVAVRLEAGEFACLLGPNGAGKSTLLRTLARVQPPLAGSVLIGGDDVRALGRLELARRLSVVLTERVQVGLLSAYDVVALGRYPHTGWGGRLFPHDHQVVVWALTATGSRDLAARPLHELSDGERQRILVARALAQEPRVMLLDEPTAFLDVPHRVELMELLRRLAHDTGVAVLLSTHDVELALRTADVVWLVTPDGGLVTGGPEDLALDGALAAAFPDARIAFDAATGGFVPKRDPRGAIVVSGEGAALHWTRRAVERAGYLAVEESSPTAVGTGVVLGSLAIDESAALPCWRLEIDGTEERMATLREVERRLAEHEGGRRFSPAFPRR